MKSLLPLLAALTLVVTGRTTVSAETPAEKLGWKLAVHSYTFQKFSIFDAIDKTSELGIKSMSISGTVMLPGPDGKIARKSTIAMTDEEAAAIKTRLKEKGVATTFVNMGVVHPTVDEAESRKIFEGAKKMGIDTLVAEPETHGKMEELGPVMDVVEKLAKEYNIKVAIHNHPNGPKSFYWNPDTVLAAVKGRSPLLGACADVGHWTRSGLDTVDCLKKLEGRVITLHFKDVKEATTKSEDVPWGTGVSNVKGMMAELKRQHFQGYFCIEYENNSDSQMQELALSVKFFNDTCAELAK